VTLRTLLVLPEPPLPEGRAAGRCMLAMLDGLRAHGVEVHTLAARQAFALPGEPPADARVEVVGVPPETPGWRARWLRLRQPVGELGRGVFARRVQELAAGADLLHLEETATARCSAEVAVPALLHVHFLVRRDRPLWPPWDSGARYAVEQALAERSAARRHRWLMASSPVVAAELRRLAPQATVELVPLSLRPQDYDAAPLDGAPVAGLIGTAAWPPTALAMRRAALDVWPAVCRAVPGARLRIAGRGTAALLGGGALPGGVEVVGEVESASQFLRGLSLLLYPLPRGSGMKVKVLEAIACGVPVVTTSAGAEGVDGGDGVVVSDDMNALAAAAARLLGDAAERRQRGAAARQAFLRRYAPGPATEPLVDLYRRMAAARG